MTLIFDLEADNLLLGLSRIHTICVWNVEEQRGMRFNDIPGRTKAGTIEEGVRYLQSASVLVGHNIINFDIPAIKKLYPWFTPQATLWDTLVCSRVMWTNMLDKDLANAGYSHGRAPTVNKGIPAELFGRHSLESWGYRLGCRKGDFAKTKKEAGETVEQIWAEWTEEMENYCVQDVVVTSRLWALIQKKDYSQQCLRIEHDFASIVQQQVAFGFVFNKTGAEQLYVTLAKRRLELTAQLQEVFPPRIETMKTPAYWECNGGQYGTKGEARKAHGSKAVVTPGPMKTKSHPFNPGSGQQVADRLRDLYGWMPTKFTPSGLPVVSEEVLECLKYPEAKVLCEYLMVVKRIGQVAEGEQAWIQLERNGRIYGEVNTGGAVTGRCTHSKPNVAQVPRCGSPYGKECRALFGPPPGMVQVGWDASGLELRCLAHYMAEFDDGAYGTIIVSGDIHTENQKAAGLPTRNDAKTFIYAFLYGAGDEKIGSIVGKGRTAGSHLRASFLRKIPALNRLTETVQAQASRGFLIGLDGRRLHVRSKHAALNTLLQSCGAILMKLACILQYNELIARGYKWGVDFAIMANVHDEIQFCCRPELAEEIGKSGPASLKKAGEILGFRCPLDGEYKQGANWAECH
jgi:DNA polymerase I